MILNLSAWDGWALTGGNYNAFIIDAQPLLTPGDPVWTEIAGNFPALTGKRYAGGFLAIQLVYTDALANKHLREAEIRRRFPVRDQAPIVYKRLVATDSYDSNTAWYVDATPISVVPEQNSTIIVLALKYPAWTISSPTTANWLITDTGVPTRTTFTIKGDYGRPRFAITPTTPLTTNGYDFIEFRDVQPPSPTIVLGNYPLEIGNSINISALLRDNANKVLINLGGGINDSQTTIPYDNPTGSIGTTGTGMIDNEQITWTGKTGTTSGNLTGVTRGANDSTPATHADNATIYKSIVKWNGDDFQVLVDGVPVPRHFGNWNTTALKIWVVLPWSPRINMTLLTAIDSSSDISEIEIKNTPNNVALLTALVSYGGQSGIMKIGSEYFTYTGIDITNRKLTGVVRGALDSTRAAHVTASIVVWIQHNITLMYGNLNAESWTQDDSLKPMFNLDTSTNTSWVYTEFRDRDALGRAASWIPTRFYSKLLSSGVYTGSHGVNANPATEIGMRIADKLVSNVWYSENATMEWELFCAAGVSNINSITGATYRANTDFPANVRVERSVNGNDWVTVLTVSSPGSAATWTAYAPANQAITSSQHVRIYMDGTLKAAANNYAAFELQGVTIVPTSANVPVVTSGSAYSNYTLDARITNVTTGEWLRVTWPMRINQTIYVDCDARTCTYADGSPCPVSIFLSTDRVDWLNFVYGTTGGNVLQWDQIGTQGVTNAIRVYDKVGI